MVQDFVFAAYRWLLSTAHVLEKLLPWIVIAVSAAVLLWVAVRRLDPDTAEAWRSRLSLSGVKLRTIALLGVFLLVLCGALVQARKTVGFRQMTVEESPASRRNVPQLGGIVQYAPRVGVMQEKTYTRTMRVPPYYVDRLGTEGLQVLAPYLNDPSAENVTKLVDSFKKSGTDVIFTRELTRIDEVPISADAAEVKVAFDHHGSASGHRYYDAKFDGQYRFRNPLDQPAEMRVTFPLPQGGGTVQGFAISSGSKRVTEPDEHGEYAWVDTVPAHGDAVVNTHYAVTGSRGFAYALGSEQRRIGDFHLVASSSQAPRYLKTGIYPTSTTSNTSDWKLKDVITAQSITMIFPSLDLDSQLLDKTLTFAPLVLLLFAIAAFLINPQRVVVGSLAFGMGMLGMAVLSSYASPMIATLAGAALAVLAGGFALNKTMGWLASLGCGLLCISFLSAEHGGLIAWCLGMVFVLGLLATRMRPRAMAT